MTNNKKKLTLSNSTYDRSKKVVELWLPGLATLYFTLSQIWGLPYGEEVVGTLAALAIFGGTILGISTKNYRETIETVFDGALVVDKEDALKDTYTLELTTPLYELDNKDEVKLEVRNVRGPDISQ